VKQPAVSYSVLEPRRNAGYGRQVLPSARDEQILLLMGDVTAPAGFARALAAQPLDSWRVLNVFAERAASLAVRLGDPALLAAGLTAFALAAEAAGDERDVLPALSLLWAAAEMIGRSPHTEFRRAAELTGRSGGPLRAFAERDPADRSIQAMGYETADDGGFVFRRTW
jgi:hypothetical protein